MIMGPVWVGKKMINTETVSYLGGPKKAVEKHILLGTFNFIANERLLHQRIAYTMLDMLGEFGGL
jgi:hypothetical protein